jgi:hypothetical protein
VFLVTPGLGQSLRAWTLPTPLNLAAGSPSFGQPALASVSPGSYSSTVPGWVNFTVPNYTALSITLRGAGGGGSSDVVSTAAGNGETSQFNLASGSPPPGLFAEGLSLGANMLASGGLAGVGPVPADQGGSGGTVTVGGGGAGGLGIIGTPPSGSASYTTPTLSAPYNFVVPVYTTLSVDVRGGGGGASDGQVAGQSGSFSAFDNTGFRVQANGGGGASTTAAGAPGDGLNGTVTLGGGGAGSTAQSQHGGNGGKVVRTFNAGDMTVGSTRTVSVGFAGADGVGSGGGGDGGGDGLLTRRAPRSVSAEDGSVFVTWSYTAPHPATYYSGSAGGRVTKNWLRTDVGAPPPGTIISIYIGNGGTPANTPLGPAGAGQPGRIDITWS